MEITDNKNYFTSALIVFKDITTEGIQLLLYIL